MSVTQTTFGLDYRHTNLLDALMINTIDKINYQKRKLSFFSSLAKECIYDSFEPFKQNRFNLKLIVHYAVKNNEKFC
jgi:hypothetical protein